MKLGKVRLIGIFVIILNIINVKIFECKMFGLKCKLEFFKNMDFCLKGKKILKFFIGLMNYELMN